MKPLLSTRRVLCGAGRDSRLDLSAAAGVIHALPKAHVDIDGKPHPEKTGWTRMLTFREIAERQ